MNHRDVDRINPANTNLSSQGQEPTLQVVTTDPVLPLTLYGPELSYFTGKLEAVIRYTELP